MKNFPSHASRKLFIHRSLEMLKWISNIVGSWALFMPKPECLMFARYLAAFACIVPSAQLHASENGGNGNYGIGVHTIMGAPLPPEDVTMFYAYAVRYSANRFLDDNGDSSVPGFDATIDLQAYRALHTWGTYGGVKVSSGIILETANVSVEVAGAKDTDFGPTLFAVDPINVGMKLGDLYLRATTYFWFPLGPYDETSLANSALNNYVTISPAFYATWLPSPKWELTVDAMVSFNFRNKDTDYKSGDLLGTTFGMGYRPFDSNPKWQFGINGFFARQVSDDDIDGIKVPTGFRFRKLAYGPQVSYWLSPACAVVLKWQHETAVRNAPKGDAVWLQVAFPLQM